jgi:hypothetical protein
MLTSEFIVEDKLREGGLRTLSIPTARKPPTPEARELAAWKIPKRSARSEGLYQTSVSCQREFEYKGRMNQQEKYMTQVGTTPASGIPRKKRDVSKPAAFLVAEMAQTMVPNKSMIRGK